MATMGEQIRQALGDGPDPLRRTKQRARLLNEVRRRPARLWKELAVGVVAAGLGSALVLWQWGRSEGLKVVSTEQGLVFNEASQVDVEPGGRMHVERTTPHEAVVVLDSGDLHASITSGRKNVWRFRAGPNEVVVRGTKLSIHWAPETQALAVAVTEGKVEVHLADGRIQWVRKGERFAEQAGRAVAPQPGAPLAAAPAVDEAPAAEPARVDDAPAAPAPPVAAAQPPRAQVAKSPLTRVDAQPPSTAPAKKPAAPLTVAAATPPEPAPARDLRPLVPEWKRQAVAGHYGRAVALAEEQGLDAAMQDASSDDLLLLADAARLVRRADLGRSVLSALREKFAGTADAAEAAFRLGRLDFDGQRYAEAARSFDLYAREAPEGAFSGEALGRRLDALRRVGDARAFEAAKGYLEKYPKGPYGPLAHEVLGGAAHP
jgi:hypothetical protein